MIVIFRNAETETQAKSKISSFNKDLTATPSVPPKSASQTSLNPNIMFNKLKMLQSDPKWKSI